MKSHFSFVPLLLALWTTTLLCFGHLPLACGQTFCIDSTADPKVISSSQFAEEAAVVRTLIEWFANRTALADLTSGVEVSEIKQEMEYSWIPENLQPVVGEGSWVVVTKSTSQVLLDTSSSAQPPAAAMGGPGLNYETTKAMLCSHLSQQPLIFNHYGDHTSNMYTRSYSQALQTSLDYEWYAISVRIPTAFNNTPVIPSGTSSAAAALRPFSLLCAVAVSIVYQCINSMAATLLR